MEKESSVFNDLMNYSAKSAEGVGTEVQPKKLKPSEKLLEDIKGFGFDLTQLGEVLKVKGNQLIVSSAGSGKTTSTVFKIIYDLKSGRSTVLRNINGASIRTPDTIWVSTFLKTGADELKSAYRKWCSKLQVADMSQTIQFSTLHAEFKRALTSMGVPTNIISETENKKLLKKVLKYYHITNQKGKALNEEELSSLFGALTCTRNRLDAKRYDSDIYESLGVTGSIVDCILRDWKAERIIKDSVDFEDLQEILYDSIYVKKDKKVIDFVGSRYRFIYLDEFQDVSQIQYAVLKAYSVGAKQVVAIGDDDQTIYSWRGSDNSIITEKFSEDFVPVKSDLSVNFRCPENILNAIKPSIANNKKRFEKTLKSAESGGIVRVGGYPGYRQMVEALGEFVYDDVVNGRSVAVLCRVNSDGLMPALFFDKLDRCAYSVSGSNMTLDSYIGRLVMSIVKLFTEKFSPDVKRALGLLSWDEYGVSKLMEVCRANRESFWTIPEEDLRYSCGDIAEKLISWRDFRRNSGDVTALKLVLQDYRYNVFVKDNQFNDVVKSVLISIESLLDCFPYESAEEFQTELESINDRLKAREKKKGVPVKIATVHEFKGKEADSVYIWNDSEDVFPYKRSCETEEEFEEERRIHYIAGTRAKKICTYMYLRNRKGSFINELDLSDAVMLEGKTSGILKREMAEQSEEDSNLANFINQSSST